VFKRATYQPKVDGKWAVIELPADCQDFTTNDVRITRALDSLMISATSITGDKVVAEDVVACVQTLRHLLKEADHHV
jgi:hypothetical protein